MHHFLNYRCCNKISSSHSLFSSASFRVNIFTASRHAHSSTSLAPCASLALRKNKNSILVGSLMLSLIDPAFATEGHDTTMFTIVTVALHLHAHTLLRTPRALASFNHLWSQRARREILSIIFFFLSLRRPSVVCLSLRRSAATFNYAGHLEIVDLVNRNYASRITRQ